MFYFIIIIIIYYLLFFFFFFQAEDGIRDVRTWLEFRRVLFRSIQTILHISQSSEFYLQMVDPMTVKTLLCSMASNIPPTLIMRPIRMTTRPLFIYSATFCWPNSCWFHRTLWDKSSETSTTHTGNGKMADEQVFHTRLIQSDVFVSKYRWKPNCFR